MTEISLKDANGQFAVTVLGPDNGARIVLFGVGFGGDPGRHKPLLKRLSDNACTVVAPHFERPASLFPTETELSARARRMRLALDSVARPNVPVAGVGHSIGAAILLALAGGCARVRSGRMAAIDPDERLGRLVLMAPATDFFQVPGSLDDVRIPILAFAGTEDNVTPASRVTSLQRSVGDPSAVEVNVVKGAGHFSFMNTPPPNTVEPLSDRDSFLAALGDKILAFIQHSQSKDAS
jgi:alpha-beta hydrolase superfamily lysophospholipase